MSFTTLTTVSVCEEKKCIVRSGKDTVLLTLHMKYYFYRQRSSTSIAHAVLLLFLALLIRVIYLALERQALKTIRYELVSTPAYLERTKGKHILIFDQITKNTPIILVYMGKIKGFLFAVRHREIQMTGFLYK